MMTREDAAHEANQSALRRREANKVRWILDDARELAANALRIGKECPSWSDELGEFDDGLVDLICQLSKALEEA